MAFHALVPRLPASILRTFTTIALVVTALTTQVTAAQAATLTLVNVTGSGGANTAILDKQAAAVGFTLGADYTNVAISAPLFCIDCTGVAYLMKSLIGPSSSLANVVEATPFKLGVSSTPLFSGLSLTAGSYFLALALSESGGSVSWFGSDPETVTTAPGSSAGLNLFAESINTEEPFRSTFLVITSSAALHFSVTAEVEEVGPSVVPLPMSAGFLVLGLFALGALRRTAPGAPRS